MRNVIIVTTVGLLASLSYPLLREPPPAVIATPLAQAPPSPEFLAPESSAPEPSTPAPATSPASPEAPAASTPLPRRAWLEESWQAYKNRFIQFDGRVIDFEDNDRTVSEGQAYAMLRAVLMDDRDTFDRTLSWAEVNLRRDQPQNLDSETDLSDAPDSLWLWQWGPNPDGTWRIIDANFATDADIDAVTALIWGHRRWGEPRYLELAQEKLADIWDGGTLVTATGRRYLIPGPQRAFQPTEAQLWLNPSYFAPYAFRLFSQIDPSRDWQSLIDSSYFALEQATALSRAGLPPDWVAVDPTTDQFAPLPANASLRSRYSFDAIRVWWRIAWDAALFNEPRARSYLQTQLRYFEDRWPDSIAAAINLNGEPAVDFESTAQFGMLELALSLTNPDLAAKIEKEKLWPTYSGGIWDNDRAYYTQNLAWLGLFPPTDISPSLLR